MFASFVNEGQDGWEKISKSKVKAKVILKTKSPTSQDALRWNPSRLSDACAPKKDPNSGKRQTRNEPDDHKT